MHDQPGSAGTHSDNVHDHADDMGQRAGRPQCLVA
jgi:hypothetical protein